MAKPTKSGLGRGLNSLLGGTYETSSPVVPSPTTERITVNSSDETVFQIEKNPHKEPSNSQALSEQGIKEDEENTPIKKMEDYQSSTRLDEEIDIDLIAPNPDQPRTNFKKEEIEELAHSIEKDGLLQPILVREAKNGTYEIIAGERRWKACKFLGLDKVPIRIKEANDSKALELALVENLQRSNLNPIEEAYGYKRLMEREGMTQAEVAQAMSKGRSTVANALRLLELPETAQQMLFEEKISAGHARAILSVPTKDGRESLTNKIVDNKMSVREAESLARLMSGKSSTNQSSRQPLPPSYKKVAKTLRETLKTNVRVKSSKGKNKIEIEFKDEEDLERVFKEIVPQES